MNVKRLEEIAQQLVARVRDDDPDANGRWLAGELTDPADWFRLCFVLAAAVPDELRWSQLVAWTDPPVTPAKALRPHGTAAAVRRHEYWREPLCDACKDYERVRKRLAYRRKRLRRDVIPGEEAA